MWLMHEYGEVIQGSAQSGQRPADVDAAGLSAAQVAERAAAGLVNDPGRQPTRTIGQILAANILTRFNAILGGLFVVIATVGPLQDGLFGLVLVANSGVGIIQELRAKRTGPPHRAERADRRRGTSRDDKQGPSSGGGSRRRRRTERR